MPAPTLRITNAGSDALTRIRALVRTGRLSEALQIQEQGTAGPHCTDPEWLILHAELLQQTGQDGLARNVVARLVRMGVGNLVRARCHLVTAQCILNQEGPKRAVDHFQKAIARSRSGGDMALLCRAQSRLLTTLAHISTPASVSALVRDTEHNISAYGDALVAADFHARVAQIEATRGSLPAAEQHVHLADTLLTRCPNQWLEASVSLAASAVHFTAENLEQAQLRAERALSCGEESGHARIRMAATANLGLLALHVGDLDGAETYLGRALALSTSFPVAQISALDSLAQLWLARGQHRDCDQLIQRIEDRILKHEPSVVSWQQLAVASTRIRFLQTARKWEESWLLAQRFIREADARRDSTHRVAFRILGADALIVLERTAEASVLLDEAARLNKGAPIAVIGEVARARAALQAKQRGDTEPTPEFLRALRILSATAGLSARIDGSSSYRRSFPSIDGGVRNALCRRPWDLEVLEGTEDDGPTESTSVPSAVSSVDVASLLPLASRPALLGQEALVLLRDSGCTRSLALLDRGADSRWKARVCLGWSSDEALRAETDKPRTISISLGSAHGTEWLLLAVPRKHLACRDMVSAIAAILEQAASVAAFEVESRARACLWPLHQNTLDKDGVYAGPEMRQLFATAKQVAASDLPVLITGETGTRQRVILARADPSIRWRRSSAACLLRASLQLYRRDRWNMIDTPTLWS